MIKLIDTKVKKLVPEVRIMTKSEHISIFPDNKTPRSINLVVKHNVPVDIDKILRNCGYSEKEKMRIAGFFIKKYPSMKFVEKNLEIKNSEDDLDEMKYRDLQHLYTLMVFNKPDVKTKPIGLKRDKIIALIRKLRDDGVEPMSESEFMQLKEKRDAEKRIRTAEAVREKYAREKMAKKSDVG